MKLRALFILLALALLLLAVGGWLVQALGYLPRLLVAAALTIPSPQRESPNAITGC